MTDALQKSFAALANLVASASENQHGNQQQQQGNTKREPRQPDCVFQLSENYGVAIWKEHGSYEVKIGKCKAFTSKKTGEPTLYVRQVAELSDEWLRAIQSTYNLFATSRDPFFMDVPETMRKQFRTRALCLEAALTPSPEEELNGTFGDLYPAA